MFLSQYTVLLVMFPSWIAAAETTRADLPDAKEALAIVALICASCLATFVLISVAYAIVKCIKRKASEPQYFIDDTPDDKNGSAHYPQSGNVGSQLPNINQIHPVLNVSYMASSVKESLAELGTGLVPFGWSRVQRIYDQSNELDAKKDIPV